MKETDRVMGVSPLDSQDFLMFVPHSRCLPSEDGPGWGWEKWESRRKQVEEGTVTSTEREILLAPGHIPEVRQ